MPWLISDASGHAVLWFGESIGDRTYHMPDPIATIELTAGNSDQPIAMVPVDSDALIGLRSQVKIAANDEISGSVTYGLYHGTKLTYHVEHLPQRDPANWPREPRANDAYQTVIAPNPAGGLAVVLLHGGKPVGDVDVKLFRESGDLQASQKTDAQGRVSFDKNTLPSGLIAVSAGITDPDAKGEFEGAGYGSTTDIVTATFFVPEHFGPVAPPKTMPENSRPSAEDSVSVVASGLPELPEELTSFGAAITGNKLYVYGGHTGEAHSYSVEEQSDRMWCLDLSRDGGLAWEQLPSGPRLQGLALVASHDRLIRVGGFTAMNVRGEDHVLHSQASVASFDPATNAWTDLAPLPEPRSSFDAAVLDDTVYVFGGWHLHGGSGDGKWLKTAWSLDLRAPDAQWKPLADAPMQRRAISVAAHDGKLFVIGGMQKQGGPTTQVEIYDPKSDSWSSGPALPGTGMTGFGSSAFATGGRLYVTTIDGDVYRLDEDAQEWTAVAKTDPARFFHRMVPSDENELLIVGGANMEIGKFTHIDRIRIE